MADGQKPTFVEVLSMKGARVRLRMADGRTLWLRPDMVVGLVDNEPVLDRVHGVAPPSCRIWIRVACGGLQDRAGEIHQDLGYDLEGKADFVEAVLRGA